MRVPSPSPTLDETLACMGTGILSSIEVGVYRKAPGAFPDSNTTLDTFQSLTFEPLSTHFPVSPGQSGKRLSSHS